jgi:chromosome segregation ATPase
MEYDDAFWRLVDVVNLTRHVADAETAVTGAKAAVAHAKSQVDAAKDAVTEANRQLAELKEQLQAAKDKAAEIPPELAEAAGADVDQRNAVRDVVVKAMAGLATATGTAGEN